MKPFVKVPPPRRSADLLLRLPRAARRFLPSRSSALRALALAVALCAVAARAAEAPPEVKLTGIADLGARSVALLEIKSGRGQVIKPVLVAGERVDSVELVAIDAKKGRVSLKVGGKATEAALGTAVETEQPPTLHFKDAGLWQLLDLYQELSGQTVLPSPSLPKVSITLQSPPALNRAAAMESIARVLRDAGIIVTPRHDKFAFVTTVSHVPRLAQIPTPPAAVKGGKNDKGDKTEVFPPGLLKFSEADVRMVLDIYQELTGRTLLVSPNLPPTKISFKTQTALTRSEAIWVLDAMFYLATIKTVPEWTKFTYVLPATRNVAAPKIADNPAADKLKGSTNSVPAGLLKLDAAGAQQVLDLYAEFLGRKPVAVERNLPAARFNLRTQTALHPVEAIYALDAMAALNGLRFVLVGEKQVKIVPAALAGNSAGPNQDR